MLASVDRHEHEAAEVPESGVETRWRVLPGHLLEGVDDGVAGDVDRVGRHARNGPF